MSETNATQTTPEPTLASIEAELQQLTASSPAAAQSVQAQITAAWAPAVAKWLSTSIAGSSITPTTESWNGLVAALPALLAALVQEIEQ